MIQKVERHVIRKNNANWQACHKLCSLSRKLGNCAVYLLRHRFFEKAPVLTRKELDTELRHQIIEPCLRLPPRKDKVKSSPNSSKVSPRRQLNTRSTLRSFKESLAYRAIGRNIGRSMSAATATKSAMAN